jgi:hypothetical protein
MRFLLTFVLLLSCLQNPAPSSRKNGQSKQQPDTSNQAANANQRGTEQSPLVVKMLPTTKTPEEAKDEADERKAKSSSDWWAVFLTGVLAFIAFLQFLVYTYQAKKLRETVESAGEQAEAMERHIGEAARSATAMERIADSIKDGNRLALRAYVSVIIGGATHQERNLPANRGGGDLKFDGKVQVVNTGATPARKVHIRKAAAILPAPIAPDFAFPLPDEPADEAYATIGAHQNYIVTAVVPDFVPDDDVEAIKIGAGRNLCVWGVIAYEDIFGGRHTTKFGQQLSWMTNGNIFGLYIPGQNDSD